MTSSAKTLRYIRPTVLSPVSYHSVDVDVVEFLVLRAGEVPLQYARRVLYCNMFCSTRAARDCRVHSSHPGYHTPEYLSKEIVTLCETLETSSVD